MSLIGWDLVCRSKTLGGLGLRKIRIINKTLLAKQIWRSFSSSGEWKEILRSKYMTNCMSLKALLDSPILPHGSTCW